MKIKLFNEFINEAADYGHWAKKFDTVKHIYVDGGKGGTVCGSVAACLGNNYATTDMKVCPKCLTKKPEVIEEKAELKPFAQNAYWLSSVKSFINKKTLMVSSSASDVGESVDDKPDSWFKKLSTEDLGTVNNLINAR